MLVILCAFAPLDFGTQVNAEGRHNVPVSKSTSPTDNLKAATLTSSSKEMALQVQDKPSKGKMHNTYKKADLLMTMQAYILSHKLKQQDGRYKKQGEWLSGRLTVFT